MWQASMFGRYFSSQIGSIMPMDSRPQTWKSKEPLNRFVAGNCFVDVPEDQLTFAACVRGANNASDLWRSEYAADNFELFFRLLVRYQRPHAGNHRQQFTTPGTPLRANVLRLRKSDKMADRPRHNVSVAVQESVTACVGTQDSCDVASHRGLLSDDRYAGLRRHTV